MKRNSQPKWINTGGVFIDKDKVRHLNGSTFFAEEKDIPKAFRSTIKPFDANHPIRLPEGAVVDTPPTPEAPPRQKNGVVVDPAFDAPGPETVTKFEIHARGGGWYDVLNLETQKPMNENALHVDEAKTLLKDLCG